MRKSPDPRVTAIAAFTLLLSSSLGCTLLQWLTPDPAATDIELTNEAVLATNAAIERAIIATATAIAAPSPTPHPTLTLEPTVTESPQPTVTQAAPPTHTSRPTATPARSTLTPTQIPPPPLVVEVTINGCQVTLRWSSPGALPENLWFSPRIWKSGSQPGSPASRTWTDQSIWTVPLSEPGEYNWEIAVCQTSPSEGSLDDCVIERGTFWFKGCPETPTLP